MNYQGVIIEESLGNKDILKDVKILETKVEETISKALDSEHAWYADFKNDTHHYIIFRNKVFYIDRKSKEQYEEAKQHGISLDIPEYQVDFAPDDKIWER